MTIKALIFDFDGLILDTETPEFLTWQEIYKSFECQLSLTEWLACVGTSQDAFDPIDNLIERSKVKVEPDKVLKTLHENANAKIVNQPIMPGVLDYLHSAKKLDLRIGLASSSTRDWVTGHLERLQIKEYFEAICTSDDVTKVKPDPSLYLCSVNTLNVLPEEAIAFEDSLNGMNAAKTAGLHCVVVPNTVTKQLTFTSADLQLSSLKEKSLQELIERFNGHT